MITIYHNPRCSKSRQGLEILKNSGKEFVVVEYLKEPFSAKGLKDVLQKLDKSPENIVRKNEKVWKDDIKGKDYNNDELIKILIENPKLIERPIVTSENAGVIGRPPENITEFLK